MKKRALIIAYLAIVILVTVGVLAWQRYQLKPGKKTAKIHLNSEEDITLTPTHKNAAGIPPKSSFILASKSALEKDILVQSFKIIPEIAFDL